MAEITIRSQSPYYDDFDATKDYVQVLFRPGYPVQARELTTLQSFLQEQTTRLGDAIFADGGIVKSAELTVTEDVHQMVLSGSGNSVYTSAGALNTATLTTIENLVGTVISDQNDTIQARVIASPNGVNTTSQIGNIYVKYITSTEFDSDGGYLYAFSSNNSEIGQDYYNTFSNVSRAIIASTSAGIYYVSGHFVRIGEQSIVLSSGEKKFTGNIGFTLTEEAITQNDDSSLFDNARGTTNEGAPGAHRLKYSLTLTSKGLDDPADSTFYRIATYIDGVRQEVPQIDKTNVMLNQLLAIRTYDESGDYALTPFQPVVSEGDSESNVLITVSPAKAYVRGYDIVKTSPSKIYLERESGTNIVLNNKTPVYGPTYLEVSGQTGTLLLNNSAELVALYSGATQVGVARPWAIDVSYAKGLVTEKLFLYDIKSFSTFTVSGTVNFSVGDAILSGRTTGYIYSISGSTITVVSATSKLKRGAEITTSSGGSANITSIPSQYQLSDVDNVISNNGYSATVSSYGNENSSLFEETSKYMKTFRDFSNSSINVDNDYTVIDSATDTAVSMNDQTHITKTLKYAYMKIESAGSGVYGWNCTDREVSLFYPDVYRVYKINQTSDSTFSTGLFSRLNVTTTGSVPQGSILTGNTSGSKAIVALSNSTTNEVTIGTHKTQTGTGSASTLEVIFTQGVEFTSGETLSVSVPSYESAYSFTVTYNSVTDAIGSDITGSFLFDDGQRSEYYDISRLIRKENTTAPNTDIVVFFSYFEATPGTNHFYSVDSYADESWYGVDPRFFNKTREIKPQQTDEGKQLRNGVDFRLRVATNSTTTVSPFDYNQRTFQTQDKVFPGTTFTTNAEYYLGRSDLVSLEKTSFFKIISGVPSISPEFPKKSEEGMVVFYATLKPVVRYPESDVLITKVDNRRYTMRDIGELEARINKVEENLELSMLEIQALNDEVSGRTKSGFVVSNFADEKNDGISDYDHPEYNATIDILKKELIPAQTGGVPIPLDVSVQTNISTFFDGYYLRSFSQEEFSTQMNATSSQRINPFATWSFEGDLTLNPSIDNWHIRKDNYFTSLYGELKPFSGSAADFQAFNAITTASPGGRATSLVEWTGTPKSTTTTRRTNASDDSNPDFWGQNLASTQVVTQAQTTTTTTKFDKPRATGEVTTTAAGTQVIQNPQDYWARSLTVNYSAKNLKPNTVHNIKFGEKELGTATSDSRGEVSGSFVIPAQTFKAGTHTVEISDTVAGDDSFSYAQFKSIGHFDIFNNVSNTATEIVTKSTKTVEKSRRTWYFDPIAQMFMLPNSGYNEKQTSILTSIDLWFAFVDTRPQMDKVKVEIREAVNGYPGGPGQIIGETDFHTLTKANETTTISDSSAVNIKFREPVVLRGGVEYAIVVKCPSDATKTYVAEIGQSLLDGSGIHASQPNVGGYFGSFFVSQNASTWTAEQNKDMTYRLYRAKFDTGADSVLTLSSNAVDSGYFLGDIGAYNQGLAMETFAHSNYVKVYHPNHGMHFQNAVVTISGVETGTYNGIPDSELNVTSSAIYYPTLNSYFIKTATKATDSGKINTGTFTTFATQEIVYDSMITNLMYTKEDGDNVSVSVTTRETSPMNLAVGVNGVENVSSEAISSTSYGTITVEPNSLVEFEDPQIVRSKTNNSGSGVNDLVVKLTLTGTDYTSPILRTDGSVNTIVFRNIVGYSLTDSEFEFLSDSELDSDSTADDISSYTSKLSAIQSETENSSWVSKQIDLEIPADGFTVKFSADMEPTSMIEAAYKIRPIGDNTPFEELDWSDFPAAQQINEDNYGAFSSDPIVKNYTMRAETDIDFTSFKIRLRMRTENEAQIPRISDLRIIADV